MHHSFFYISLASLHGYDMKVPVVTFFGVREPKTTTFFFFSWTSIQSFRNKLPKNSVVFRELNEVE